ncbi:hypothetical protein [Salibacter halophilus]|uniref:Uncharacterized protein n=1 Tax=Salibacter halophilus TaxID=1803916 RepID=A0A6N6MDF0_9FLAO|nr:hypothetical protein [Salibacter halophilus]KAB1065609.1 hypothetical protein F3059_02850 [Salibacter halophilus]
MNAQMLIGSLKQFFWDIIGYLLPGFIFLIGLMFFLADSYFVPPLSIGSNKDLLPFIVIAMSYILGYFIYSVSLLKDRVLFKVKSKWHISRSYESFKKNSVYLKSLDKVEEEYGVKKNDLDLRGYRSLIMSAHPKIDHLTYTFMFRSDIFNHLNTISLMFLFSSAFGVLLNLCGIKFFQYSEVHIVLLLVMLLALYPLKLGRWRFYSMSMRIPFSVYIAKSKGKE